jgi:tetratricopeptide (TPR) repeat protein
MSEALIAELRHRYEAVERMLSEAEGGVPHPREEVREGIVTLFRDIESLVERLTGLREEIRPLVERYKTAFPREAGEGGEAAGGSGGGGGEIAGGAAPPVRVDHLGASTYLERAWSAIAGANYELSVRELGRALELSPGNERAEVLLGWAMMRLGRISEARALLEEVLERAPANELARANLGYVCMREGRFAEAIEHLARAQRAGSADRTAELYAHLYMGMVYTEREMYRDARTLLARALELGPNLVEAHWEIGRSHYREGDLEAALTAWQTGAETNRFNPWGERCGEAAATLREGGAVSLS